LIQQVEVGLAVAADVDSPALGLAVVVVVIAPGLVVEKS
jgi:hypothetical protein